MTDFACYFPTPGRRLFLTYEVVIKHEKMVDA